MDTETARLIASAVSKSSDPYETGPIADALLGYFPDHDWHSMIVVGYGGSTLAEEVERISQPDAFERLCRKMAGLSMDDPLPEWLDGPLLESVDDPLPEE